MGLFGTVSDMIAKSTDEDILRALGANDYSQRTKDTLIKNIRASDAVVKTAKDNYGNGISVKGILVNVSGFHFLQRTNLIQETGKSWSDKYVIQPIDNVSNLDTCAFFDAKADGAAKGCRAGFTYKVLDKDSVVQGVISIAWENPYIGDFVYCAMVSKNQDLLQTCLNYCNNNSTSKIEGDVTISIDNDRLKQFITVNVKADNQSTAYLLVGMKTDDMVREIYGTL
jgi:hypothetical protein